ncbi:Patatin-like phospholipase domain-containing protein [Escovopsis weberi]|uniref:Patatin-like phospholipase domain-containing protein n=1 Tax=Escovopsis weberi TaxID=150374 RepID=A0A0M9VT83_ESCWE|nr:Patatin-like phospholipase domain-containing protein [Escovopsis weberi]
MSKSLPKITPYDDAYGFPREAFDPSVIPDCDAEFLDFHDLAAFESALHVPDPLQSPSGDDNLSIRSPGSVSSANLANAAYSYDDDVAAIAASANIAGGYLPTSSSSNLGTFVTAQNDWAPVNPSLYRHRRGSRRKRPDQKTVESLLGSRTTDETREGHLYQVSKWPLLFFVFSWLIGLSILYLSTRLYIFVYEHFFTWRGRREILRKNLRRTSDYDSWVSAAQALDIFLGRQTWKELNDFAYYDSKTVKRVWGQIRKTRTRADAAAKNGDSVELERSVDELKTLMEACVKNNFVGVENPRLYSQTYYGTKNLVQNFVDEVEKNLKFILDHDHLEAEQKRALFKHMNANYGRTALCLSGGATFAYYHFGVVKAMLDADLLPDVITGTSGGALVAALVATRTNEELKELLVPALATKITACREPMTAWVPRWWKTGARFDSLDWAERCSWFTRGSMTFREAYKRTGRILNVSCVPADPHSPTILCNYLTSPDCVIWSAVLASAAVPGILNPVVLMMKRRDGTLAPYSFGHKWKDGSLRTDIPLKALNTHFNVNFTIVSQVNPHINLFFFSPRGAVGLPVTHRKGKGWRGGYLMSAFENYLKLDLNKWLKFIRHAELLPRPLGQDWSQLWLQEFSGTITIWPKSVPSDYWYILTDPDSQRLARMLHEGQQSTFPKLKFLSNRLKLERLIERGRRETRQWPGQGEFQSLHSEEELGTLLVGELTAGSSTTTDGDDDSDMGNNITELSDAGAHRGSEEN